MVNIKEIYFKYKKIIRYLICGGLTTLVNFSSYYVLARILNIDEVLSSGLSWCISVLFAYVANRIFVFESKNKILREIISFFLARISTGIICDILIFALLVKVLNVNDIVSKIIIEVIVITLNYIASKVIVFKDRTKNIWFFT